ncbi:MAG TPA: hypothetical protein VFS18_05395 [Actinomycetota bacterium]|nr:hypothetical protein [Actinomycetota bacterium]
MQQGPSLWTRASFGCLALVGLIAAHAGAFALVAPDPHRHSSLLATTGHGRWWWIGAVVASFAAGALIGPLARRRAALGSGSLGSLLLFQTLAFVILEVSERSLAGIGATSLFGEPAFLLGVGAQVVTAAIGAVLLKLVTRARTASSGTGRLVPKPSTSCHWIPRTSQPDTSRPVSDEAWNLRGPPQLLPITF